MVHTNTIEEFEAIDTNKLIQEEQEKFEKSGFKGNNRFILLVFGDLKKYNFSYRFCLLRLDTSNLGSIRANVVSKCLDKEKEAALSENLLAYFKKDDNKIESE
jgi:hypothetical protein